MKVEKNSIININMYQNFDKLFFLFFKKMVSSYWFYLLIILVPFLFDFSFITQTPVFLVIDSTFAFALILNTLLFYGILFFNFRKSHFYKTVNLEFNNKKSLIYLPIFLNLIIVAIFTIFFSILFFYIFMNTSWLVFQTWSNTENYFYSVKSIKDFRWGLLIYYFLIIFIITFVLAFLLQNLSKNLSSFLIFSLFVIVIVILFSGTYGIVSAFDTPRSNNSDKLLYSYNQDTQVLSFKPYYNRNDPEFIEKRFFKDFSIFRFFQTLNPYYYITAWGQFDIFIDFYRTTSIILPGIDPIIIIQNDPSTWVKYNYEMFSFTNWLWSSYIFCPYIFIIFYGFLGIFLKKRNESE